MSNKILKAALAYAESGISIIPIDPASKRPTISSWKEFQDRIATNDEIKNWFENNPNWGIAIICGKVSNLCVVDADYYNLPHLADKQRLMNFLSLHFDVPLDSVPTSKTPRGGEQYFLTCPEIPLASRKVSQTEKDLKFVDVKCSGGYVVAPPTARPDGLEWSWKVSLFDSEGKRVNVSAPKIYDLLRRFENSIPDGKPEELGDDGIPEPGMFQSGNRDNALFRTATYLIRGGAKRSEIHRIIYNLGKMCNPPADSPNKDEFIDIEAKINSAYKGSERRDINVAQLTRDWVMMTTGEFNSHEVCMALGFNSPNDKKSVMMELKKMYDENLLDKKGERNATYRLKATELELQEMPDDPYSLVEYGVTLPMDLNNLVKVYPGNVILAFGAKDAGKSSFSLSIPVLNHLRMQTVYVNIESDSIELGTHAMEIVGKDIDKYRAIYKDPSKFIAYEAKSVDEFPDYIDRNYKDMRIYVFDYLDSSDDHSKAASIVNKIHAAGRGTNSVILILAQLHPDKDAPYGGYGLFFRARLIVSLKWSDLVDGGGGVMTIRSAKIARHPELGSPRGKQRFYKIVHGGPLIPIGEWFDPEKKDDDK